MPIQLRRKGFAGVPGLGSPFGFLRLRVTPNSPEATASEATAIVQARGFPWVISSNNRFHLSISGPVSP
jgi:hypothetical protein